MAEPTLAMHALTKLYGGFTAVSDLHLEIAPGELFALLGPNGAGKTTTIRMLMGILKATSGTASVHGLDCFRQRAQVMRHVGYVPDEPIFYDYLKGREIIQFVGQMHGLAMETIAEIADPLSKQLSLDDALDEYAVNYSRGMKKKLAIICSLLHEPTLWVLDEPTNGLDPFATRQVHALMRSRIAAGRSVFFSTHLLDQAQKLCDRVGMLFKGRLAAIGRLDELQSASQNTSLEEIFFAVADEAGGSTNGGDKGPTVA